MEQVDKFSLFGSFEIRQEQRERNPLWLHARVKGSKATDVKTSVFNKRKAKCAFQFSEMVMMPYERERNGDFAR